MTNKTQKSDAPSEQQQVRADFLDALGRLLSSCPRNPILKERAGKGKLRVTIWAVAKEAGRSRTLIGHDNTPYQDVRNAVLAVISGRSKAKSRRRDVDALREEIDRQKEENALLASENAALIIKLSRKTRVDGGPKPANVIPIRMTKRPK